MMLAILRVISMRDLLTDVEEQIQTTEVFDRIIGLLKTKKLRERDVEIFIERSCYGTTYRELGETYGISANRCVQIYARLVRMVITNMKAQGVLV
jgi:DNA-directed RNA polymerase sigma subunit (sigma70/sigma32)